MKDRSSREVLLIIAAGGLALSFGLLAPAIYRGLELAILVAIAVALLMPVIQRARTGTLNFFEPLVWFSAAMFMFVVLRSHAVIRTDSYLWRTMDTEPGVTRALWVSLLGILAWLAGYGSSLPQRLAYTLPPITKRVSTDVLPVCALALTTLMYVATLTFLRQSGLGISWFWEGRDIDDQAYRGSVGYLYSAPYLVIPVTIICLVMWRNGTRWFPLLLSPAIAAMLFAQIAKGNRLFLLLALLSMAAFWYLSVGKRPSLKLLVLLFPITFIMFSVLREVRNEHAEVSWIGAIQAVVNSPIRAWDEIVMGADAEAVQGLMYLVQIVPDDLGYSPGSSILSVAAQPVPRAIWTEKPMIPEERIMKHVFPIDYARNRAGATFTAMGSFYFDSGVPGVVLGMFMSGTAFRFAWEYFRREHNLLTLAVVSMLPALAVTFARASIPPTALYIFWTVVPLLVVIQVFGSRQRTPDHVKDLGNASSPTR